MAFEIVHDVTLAVRQLLGSPSDLRDWVADQGRPRALAEAGAAHQELYRRYRADFADAYAAGDAWWAGCVEAQRGLGLPSDEALAAAYEKRVAGPASAPEVVWFVRASWLAVDRLNRTLPPEDRVPPEHVLLGWLVEEGRSDYVRLLTCMPYWPIGLDAEGNWC